MLVYILIVALFVVDVIALYYNIKSKLNYEKGYKAGVMISFWWIETNTSCKDAVSTYTDIINEHPEDGIYILKLDDDGSLVFPKNAELINFQHK